MQLSGLGGGQTVVKAHRGSSTEEAPGQLSLGHCRFEMLWRAPRSSLVTSVLVCPTSFSVMVFLPESHMSTAAHLQTWRPRVLPPEACAQQKPGLLISPPHCLVTMYFSASKLSFIVSFFTKMESASGTLGPGDRILVVLVSFLCPLLYIFVVEEIRQTRISPPGYCKGRATYWGFFLLLLLFICFYKVEIFLDTICEAQAKTWFGEGFLHSIRLTVAQLENFPNFFETSPGLTIRLWQVIIKIYMWKGYKKNPGKNPEGVAFTAGLRLNKESHCHKL